jgi:hypothetical protein
MGFIVEILREQGMLARKVLTHVNTREGAGVEAEWLLAIYVKIGAVAARIISHQGERFLRLREARRRKPLGTPPAYRQGLGASRISTGCGGVSNFAQTLAIKEHILQTSSHLSRAALHRKRRCRGEVL